MATLRRILMLTLALALVLGGAGISAAPAQASGICVTYHTVRAGETLSWIGRFYGVYWPYLAQVNGILPPQLHHLCWTGALHTLQRLCASQYTSFQRPNMELLGGLGGA